MHKYQDLIRIFNNTFIRFNTRLIKGDDEPVYLPQDASCDYNRIVFAHGYYASAMHEIAHWCLAGEERRKLEDYGYWYCPDGRDKQQQAEFEQVEIKPQAIEWFLCNAAGFKFDVSSDNLNGVQPDRLAFKRKVHQQALDYLAAGLPSRAQLLVDALGEFYATKALIADSFIYPELKQEHGHAA